MESRLPRTEVTKNRDKENISTTVPLVVQESVNTGDLDMAGWMRFTSMAVVLMLMNLTHAAEELLVVS